MREMPAMRVIGACVVIAACAFVLTACGDDSASGADAAAGGGASGTHDTGDAGGAGAAAADAPKPDAKFIPQPTSSCPSFAKGEGCEDDGTSLVCTFEPKGVPPRKVRVWLDDGARKGGGALVFFWHGLTRTASDAILPNAGLGPDVKDSILASGGVLVSPEQEEGRDTSFAKLPWISAAAAGYAEGDNKDDDFLVMDEVAACAIEKLDIDVRRIHSTGISAGGLQTGQVIARRSGYVASAVVFSGGLGGGPMIQDPSNKLPVMIFWGGANDMVVINFQQTSLDLRKRLDANGQFSIMCNHGMGHLVPVDGAVAGWHFMQDHPYGTTPEPYAKKLPDFLPSYCSLDVPSL